MALSQATMTGAAMAGRRRQYLESINAACPKLTIDTDELYRSGQSNELLLVNDENLFRFPKFAHGVAALRREQAILDAVRPHLPTATPHYTFHAPSDAKAGRAFVGYRKLAGEALWRERLAQIDDDGTIDRLAVDLASFLQALHAIPPQAIDYPLQPAETQAAWSNIFTRIRRVVYPHLNAEARDWTARQFVKFLENADSFAFANVLRHGDFGASNILYSERCAADYGDRRFRPRRRRRSCSRLRRSVRLLRRTVSAALRPRLPAHQPLLEAHQLLRRMRLPA